MANEKIREVSSMANEKIRAELIRLRSQRIFAEARKHRDLADELYASAELLAKQADKLDDELRVHEAAKER
jgi:hypothetical protein